MANKEHLKILKKGVKEWNHWRESNPDEEPDLVGANLKGKNLIEANFSNANLQGASLNGADLAGADFRHAHLQGVKFTAANLTGAKFNHAIAGLQNFWAVSLVIFSLFLSLLSGLFASSAGTSLAFLFFPVIVLVYGITPNVLVLVAFGVFAITTIFRGSGVGIATGVIASGLALIIQLLVGFLGAKQGIMALATSGMATLFLGIVATVAIAVAVTAAGIASVPSIITGVLAVAGIVSGILTVGASEVRVQAQTGELVGLIAPGGAAAAWSLAITGVGVIIAWRALAEDEKQNFIRQIAIFIAAIKGTSFRRANLTDANFMEAQLKNTDLREAIITHTVWHSAKMLDRARTGFSYLQYPKIRDLVVNREGQNKNFDRLDLRGVNLSNAQLQNASFIGTDLSRANLSEADLSRAKLVQTLFEGADLTGATLTEACIQDWGISSTTKLFQIKCDCIYMKLRESSISNTIHRKYEYLDRYPADEKTNFKSGEFASLVGVIANTVNLVFKNGIDWKAFLPALQELQIKYQDEDLSIAAIEKKPDGAFVVRLNVSPQANKGEIESFAKQLYEEKLKLIEAEYRAELKSLENEYNIKILDKQQEISELKTKHNSDILELAKLAASKSIIVEAKAVAGDEIKQSGNFGVGVNKGEITTETLAGVINQLPSSSDPDKPGIKELLEQLKQAIEASEDLNNEDKAEALEQVKTLAEAGKNQSDEGTKKQAKRGITMLRGIVAGLQPTAALVTICQNALPAIARFFGL